VRGYAGLFSLQLTYIKKAIRGSQMLTNGTIFYKSGQNLACADGIDMYVTVAMKCPYLALENVERNHGSDN
jgi:hypothetical protein